MKLVPFSKLTSFGNNFVIVDETHGNILSEIEKSDFAYQATNINFGVGSDNFLIVQSCTPETMREINRARGYWDTHPDSESADFIFRMFEPDGEEAFSCGNGLMSIAKYLFNQYGIESARIMTEIPTPEPKIITIGTDTENASNWANMGQPRKMPEELVCGSKMKPLDDVISTLSNLKIRFRMHDLAPFSKKQTETLSGYLVFTGEPHMVILPDTGFTIQELPKMIFIATDDNRSEKKKAEKRVAFGSWLVHHIGSYLNRQYTDLFPSGINVNFVKLNQTDGTIEYRCFERGIYRETLACGTGALAVSYVARKLNLVDAKPLVVYPHRSRWENPDSELLVMEEESGWLLNGRPVMLFSGEFNYKKTNQIIPFDKRQADEKMLTGLARRKNTASAVIY
ncbi:MAG TPA: diaminopimelate epimerase [Deltaproteobacteria bacterium]|nr:diaminopimelate epimerase [Deltaproteobacteria bacterium]